MNVKAAMLGIGVLGICSLGFAEENGDAHWDSSVSAGLTVNSGNSDNMSANANFTSALVSNETHDIRFEINLNYGETDNGNGSVKDTDNGKGIAAYKYKMGRKYIYSDNSIFYDKMADIDYRLIVGGGIGYFVIDTDKAKMGLETGLAYIREKMNNGTSDDNLSARIALRHDQQLSENAKFWFAAEYLPNLDDTGEYLFNAEAGIEAVLTTALSLRLVAIDRYDSEVPEGTDNNDFSLISGLVYQL